MVQALMTLDDKTSRIINVIKAKYDLKDKAEAVRWMSVQFEDVLSEFEVRPEYLEKLHKIEKEKMISCKNMTEFRQRVGLN